MKKLIGPLVFSLVALTVAGQLQAQNPQITVDETGTGSLLFPGGAPIPLPCALATDPGPGGLAAAMFCNMLGPPSLVFGDVLIHDADGSLSDVIRFENVGGFGFFFYSLLGPDLADTGLPTSFFDTRQNVVEGDLGGGLNGANYHPVAGQPGFVAGFDVAYQFQSSEDVVSTPEPATMVLTGTGLAGLLVGVRRKRQA